MIVSSLSNQSYRQCRAAKEQDNDSGWEDVGTGEESKSSEGGMDVEGDENRPKHTVQTVRSSALHAFI